MGMNVFGVNVGPLNVGVSVSGSAGVAGGHPNVSVSGVGITVGPASSCRGVSLGPICLS